MDIAVINESTKYTGLGRYATEITLATNTKLFSLNLDSSFAYDDYPGQIVKFEPLIKFGSGWYISHRFPEIFLHGIRRQIKDKITQNTVIHYASQTIPHLNLNSRYLYTVHDLFGLDSKYNKNSKLRQLMRINFKYIESSEGIITVSHYVKTQLQDLGINGKIVVIYPPVSMSFKPLDDRIGARKLLGLPENKRLILSVSSQDPRKNLKAVLDTMKYLGDNYRLVRVGQPIGNCFSFNNIDDEKLNMIYNSCDALLFPSLDEGFGYPIAEAMTVGLPVVASNIPVFQEIMGNSAVLVEPDPEKLARGIRESLDNDDVFRSRETRIAKRYSADQFRETINQFYRQFMS